MSKNTHPLRLFRCEKAQREFSVCKFSARRAKIQVFLFVFSEPQPKFYFEGTKLNVNKISQLQSTIGNYFQICYTKSSG